MTTQIEVRTDMAEMTDRGDLGPPPCVRMSSSICIELS
jgi:hypothetical protein